MCLWKKGTRPPLSNVFYKERAGGVEQLQLKLTPFSDGSGLLGSILDGMRHSRCLEEATLSLFVATYVMPLARCLLLAMVLAGRHLNTPAIP